MTPNKVAETLQKQIDSARAEIRTDGFPMSISEWISLYEKEEIDIHPEFQRYYRWSPSQKSRLIESILLGIPIPPIFVSQRADGIWDVVDGLQRLSTIYQFVGILRDENDVVIPPLVLEATKYIPALKGKVWENKENPAISFDSTQRLLIKRSKIDVSIILRESDEYAKYELFQRLNTGGTPLSAQEVRNAILVMQNRDLYSWMRSLSQHEDFKECVALTDKALEEQYDLDLVLRFLVFRRMSPTQLKSIGDVNDFLTEQMIAIAQSDDFNREEEEEAFKTTFSLLRKHLGSDAMHRYDAAKRKFLGGFLISAYEVVALGLGYNYKEVEKAKTIDLKTIVKRIWKNRDFTSSSGAGVRASSRIPQTIPIGRKEFRP